MDNPHKGNLHLYRSIPRTMPMLASDPRKARIDIIITYGNRKQSRGVELHLPFEEVVAVLHRMDRFLTEEVNYYNAKADIDRHAAEL